MRNRILPILVAALVALPTTVAVAAEHRPPAATDPFARAALGGWGAAESGGRWVPASHPEAFSVGRGHATIVLTEPGTGRAIVQPDVTAGDLELAARFAFDRIPQDGNAFAYLVARHTDDGELRLKARVDELGAVFLQPTAVSGRQETGIGEEVEVPGLRLTDGEELIVRAQVVGTDPTSIRMRAWSATDVEPEAWPIQVTDAEAPVPAPGHPGIRTYVGSTVTTVPLAVSVDDWSVRVLDAPVTPPASPVPTPSVVGEPVLEPDPVLAPGAEIARDAFGRTTKRAWGDADDGGRWTHLGDGDDFRVVDGEGRAEIPAGQTRSALVPITQRDVLASATVRARTLPDGGNGWFYLVLRQTAEGEVRGRARVAPDGGVHLSISVVEDGEERQLGPEVRPVGLSTGPAAPIRIRFGGVTGDGTTTWRLKAWPATAAEPVDWALQVSDATPSLQGAGAGGLRMYVGRSVTGPSVGFGVDDVLLLAADAATGSDDPMIAGAGDIAQCGSGGAGRTARLLDTIPGTVMAIGDLAYPDGTAAQFQDCYGPTWGRHRDRTLPVPGNRDYGTPGAKGYFDYWGDQGAAPGGWQAVDVGTWRVYALNAECTEVGCGPDSAQVTWLREDLAANPRACAMAIMHDPRVSSGPHGDGRLVATLWETLMAAGVELVVSGHDHGYERFLPLGAGGGLDTAKGIVQFVAGTGGAGGVTYDGRRAGSAARDGETLGVLALTLHADGYDWRFVPVPGSPSTDSGRAACH